MWQGFKTIPVQVAPPKGEPKTAIKTISEHTSAAALTNPDLYSKKTNREQYINSLGIADDEKKQALADFDKYAESAKGLKDEIENIKKDPLNPEPKLKIVDHFIQLGRTEEARKMADEIITAYPDYSPAYGYKAKTYADKGDTNMAINIINQGIEKNPADASLYYNRATTKNVAGDTEGAVKDLDISMGMTQNPHLLQKFLFYLE